jgi:hypothetical protein
MIASVRPFDEMPFHEMRYDEYPPSRWRMAALVLTWIVFIGALAIGGFLVVKSLADDDALGRARLAMIDSGVQQANASLDGASLVLSGQVPKRADHIATIVAVRKHYPRRHIIDQLVVLQTTQPAIVLPDPLDPQSLQAGKSQGVPPSNPAAPTSPLSPVVTDELTLN